MMAKLRAAKMVAACGGCSFIGPGRHPDILQALFSGELVGTFFLPGKGTLNRRKHWIAYVLKPQGFLVVDDGARRALVEQGKSLLPSGIVEVRGHFSVGAPVHCLDRAGALIAAGLSNFSTVDIERIKGRKTHEIATILGTKDADEVIHRDNLVVMGRDGIL
jgi:glutamate 5-kinase